MSSATAKQPIKKRPDKPAKAKRKAQATGGSTGEPDAKKVNADEALERYNEIFGEIQRFVAVIESSESELSEARAAAAEAKADYEAAKDEVKRIEDLRDGAKHGLFRYLAPRDGGRILPLFDRMEKADEDLHGANATEWRKEPIAALKLSLPSLVALNDAEIMFVGQLQDRVLAAPTEWWESIPGLIYGTAQAIVDRLNDFIAEHSSK